MIDWSLLALAEAETIDAIVIAAPLGLEGEVEAVAAGRAEVVSGGSSRAESVRLGLAAVDPELVAVHDAARPLVTPELVDRVVKRLQESGADGVIAAAPIADTLKRAGEGGRVLETIPRAELWSAQTPQAFRVEALQEAQKAATGAGKLEIATDEAWLIERVGGAVLLEEAGEINLKVTDRGDLELAALMLRARG